MIRLPYICAPLMFRGRLRRSAGAEFDDGEVETLAEYDPFDGRPAH